MNEAFRAYNEAWEVGKIEKPVSVLIGGHMGTGKSTFARAVEARLKNVNLLPTGIIRAIQQANTTPQEEPYLFAHSYQLDQVNPDPDLTTEENALNGFKEQARIVEKAIVNILQFSESEGQQYIIDGNHVLPAFANKQIDKGNIITLFFHVPDLSQYLQMVSGPTHRRELTQEQLIISRYIHDFIVSQAEDHAQPLFAYNQSQRALKHIAQKLEALIP